MARIPKGSGMPIDPRTLSRLHELRVAARAGPNWKAALDQLLASIRQDFIYDNVALYVLDRRRRHLEVAHARATGRGKTSEADISWGESMAGKVMTAGRVIVEEPIARASLNRLDYPYVIGLPVVVSGRAEGALVFVRFGGPEYTEVHRLLAEWITDTASSLLDMHSLVAARAELESAQRQMRIQDDFVSNVSHELRTPLGFIKGYTTSLLRQDTVWDEKTRREFLSIIEEEADRLSQLITNMLESARLQSKTAKFRFQPLQLDTLVRDVVLRMQSHQPELEIGLDLERVRPIMGDAVRLGQVFENLFGNALKYAPGSPLKIRMRCDEQSVRVEFADRGPGIPEEYLPFVFERFYRVPADASSTGTGLGLYICRQIVLAHHGKIWAESVPNQGATFFIELPLPSST
jgi:signal transduction histidine kinase